MKTSIHSFVGEKVCTSWHTTVGPFEQ